MIQKIFKDYSFWGCLIGIIIARIIHNASFFSEYIDFFITAFLPSIGIVVGLYIEKKMSNK
jgi:uncharacterized membrane protein